MGGGNLTKHIAAALGLVVCAATLSGAPAVGGSKSRYWRRSEKVAPGIWLTRIVDREGPNRIRVLAVNPREALTLDVALANNTIPGRETTSSMARRHGAIAAVNGDFTVLYGLPGEGRPVNVFAEDGELVGSPLIWGRNFAMSFDEESAFFGHPDFSVRLTQVDSPLPWRIRYWNDPYLHEKGLAAYTPRGDYVINTPSNSCSARLLHTELPRRFSADQMSVEHSYVVDRVACRERRLARLGGVVVAAPRGSDWAKRIRTDLVEGETATIAWSIGARAVLDTIGGNPTLIEDGVITVKPCDESYFCYRNPRTGVGIKPDGWVLLVTVDGRRTRSVGMSPTQFARLFRYLGATWALNMDGGGSTTMVVDGEIVNRPSDSTGERPVGSALLVLPGPDSREAQPSSPGPRPTRAQQAFPNFSRNEAACLALTDPASTGGMLDAAAHGLLGDAEVAGRLDPVVDAYRKYAAASPTAHC